MVLCSRESKSHANCPWNFSFSSSDSPRSRQRRKKWHIADDQPGKLSLKQYHWSCVLRIAFERQRHIPKGEGAISRKAEKHGACKRIVNSQVCL